MSATAGNRVRTRRSAPRPTPNSRWLNPPGSVAGAIRPVPCFAPCDRRKRPGRRWEKAIKDIQTIYSVRSPMVRGHDIRRKNERSEKCPPPHPFRLQTRQNERDHEHGHAKGPSGGTVQVDQRRSKAQRTPGRPRGATVEQCPCEFTCAHGYASYRPHKAFTVIVDVLLLSNERLTPGAPTRR